MRYTENLNLPIVEDSDNFALAFTQPNEISEKLEEKLGSFNNVATAVTELQDSVNNVNEDITEVNKTVTALKSANDTKQSKIKYFQVRHSTNNNVAMSGGNTPYHITYDTVVDGSSTDIAELVNGYVTIKQSGTYIIMSSAQVTADADCLSIIGIGLTNDGGTFANVYGKLLGAVTTTVTIRPTIKRLNVGVGLYTAVMLQPNANGVVNKATYTDELIIVKID